MSAVSLGFWKFESVHTYMITIFAFAAGIITSGIFSIVARFKKRKKVKTAKTAALTGADAAHPEDRNAGSGALE
ncbi:MAG: lipopolysaccharide assembly protein LapA domain-containing protein [Treponema sp.]|nr:lipopolysaccharide assembly protein LapA domain-containing protein [Treponema sp.]